MNKQTLSILIVVAVTASVALTAVASTMITQGNIELQQNPHEKQLIEVDGMLPPFTTDDLAKRSKYIIVGKVTKITVTEPIIDEELTSTRIFSDVTIDVEKDLTGQYTEKQITVRILGGEDEKFIVTSDIDARFSTDERILVFVADKEPDSIWGNNYYVAGLMLGKYNLSGGKAYGPESPVGIDESTFTAKIKNSRSS